MKEIWKPILETKGLIEVSNLGNVRSLLSGKPRVLQTQVDNKGYKRVRISICGEKKSYKIHREVAKAFIPNENGLPQVNHIDGNKRNNIVTNLEWTTNQQNAIHAILNGLWDTQLDKFRERNEQKKTPIDAIRISDGFFMHFNSINEAEKYIGSKHIIDAIKGKDGRTQAKGWTFSYSKGVMP